MITFNQWADEIIVSSGRIHAHDFMVGSHDGFLTECDGICPQQFSIAYQPVLVTSCDNMRATGTDFSREGHGIIPLHDEVKLASLVWGKPVKINIGFSRCRTARWMQNVSLSCVEYRCPWVWNGQYTWVIDKCHLSVICVKNTEGVFLDSYEL